jgi:hypothetical protein
VNIVNSQEHTDRVADVLVRIREKGARIWLEDGQLRYRAPKGVLTQSDIEGIRASKDAIVSLLARTGGGKYTDLRPESQQRVYRAPLTFSQHAHWQLYELNQRPAMRHIASVTRLRGQVDMGALRMCVAEVIRRHDSLRTRVLNIGGIPTQEVSESVHCDLVMHDLAALSEEHKSAEINALVARLALEPIDMAVDPLLGINLLALGKAEFVLVVAMEHIISDLVSMNIFLRELFTAYRQVVNGLGMSLPSIPVQFSDYAFWQRNSHSSWLERHGSYWSECVARCPRSRFPVDHDLRTTDRTGWGTVPFRIGKSLKAELRDWCRQRKTTVVMGVLTAYVGLVLRWCGTSESVIRYESDGRGDAQIENTIGFFASTLYLDTLLLDDDTFLHLTNRVIAAYCVAHDRADCSYLAALTPRPEFTRNTFFNWVPQGLKSGLSDMDGLVDVSAESPVTLANAMSKKLELDLEPGVLLCDGEDEIVGSIYFPMGRFSAATMARFSRNFLLFTETLVKNPERRVNDVLLIG